MSEIETDYLVIGAGASGMAFVDALVTADPSADVVIVDRQHRPGGHWLNAYPFVRLHQPSANYGVASRQLGDNRIDEVGPNAGFYERATATEICDYFNRVLEENLIPSGRVRFLAMSDYRGSGVGATHDVVSLLTGRATTVRVRRKVVDATYVESSIPRATHPTSSSMAAFVSFLRTTSSTSATRPRATRSSARARRRWTHVCGSSSKASTPMTSAGSDRATCGCSIER